MLSVSLKFTWCSEYLLIVNVVPAKFSCTSVSLNNNKQFQSQFLIMLFYCIVTHFSPRCQFAPQFTYFCFCNVSTLLFLFYKFYYKSYKLNKLKQNGVHPVHPAEENTTEDDTTPCEAKSHVIGDYCKNGKMLLTRRTAKAAYGVGCNFNTLVKWNYID